MYMDYLPEWKIYLWKKLILNKDGEFDGKLDIHNFRFFEPIEQRVLIRSNVQKNIDRINIAAKNKSLMNISGNNTPLEDSYFYFDPAHTFVELATLAKAGTIQLYDIYINKKILLFKDWFSAKDFGPEGYRKIKEEKELTLEDLGYCYFSNYQNNPLFSYLTFKIKIDTEEIRSNLYAYLNDFGQNKLTAPKGIRYTDARKQCDGFYIALHKLFQKFGPSMTVTAEDIAKAGGWYLLSEHHFRFYETIFTLEKDSHIVIHDLRKEEVLLTFNPPVEKSKPAEKQQLKTYITKENDDFRYKGRLLQLSKRADHYQVFSALYALLPGGGEIDYGKLGQEVRSRVSKAKRYDKDRLQKFLLTNLTDRHNGFMHYAEIPETEDNGKPLISVNRGVGITFNNTAG